MNLKNDLLNKDSRSLKVLGAIFAAALLARLFWILILTPNYQLDGGGDGPLYMWLARTLVEKGWQYLDTNFGTVAVAPVYTIYLAFFHFFFPPESVLTAARIGQAVLDAVSSFAIFDLVQRIFNRRTAWIAALVYALDPRFVVQSGEVYTESLFTSLFLISIWLFAIAHPLPDPRARSIFKYLIAGASWLIAAFTRAIVLPLAALFGLMTLLPRPSKRQLIALGIAAVVSVTVLVVRSFQLYNAYGRYVIITSGFEGHFWMGSRGDGQWHGIPQFEKERQDLQRRYDGRDAYIEDALNTIIADPLAYARLLFVKATNAYLQPQGTVSFGREGESLKDLALQVLNKKMSLNDLIQSEGFFPKLIIYIFHYIGLIGGLIGITLTRRDWLKVLPLTLPIAYFTIVYTLLTIIPRYLLPIMPLYMIFAAYTFDQAFSRWQIAYRR